MDTNPMSVVDTDLDHMLLVDEEEYEDEPYIDIVMMMSLGGAGTTPVEESPWEVFCKDMIADLKLKKNQNKASMFLTPISGWIAMYPDYVDHVDTPIDLIMIEEKLINRQYESPEQFHEEMNMMIDNCLSYNRIGQASYNQGLRLREYLNEEWEKLPKEADEVAERPTRAQQTLTTMWWSHRRIRPQPSERTQRSTHQWRTVEETRAKSQTRATGGDAE